MKRRKSAALAAALVMVGASAALTQVDPASASELKLVANTTFTERTFGACSTDTVTVTGTAGENSVSVAVPDTCKDESLVLYLAQDGHTYSTTVGSDGTATFNDLTLKEGANALLTANTWPLKTETTVSGHDSDPTDISDFVTCTLVDESTGAISNDCKVSFKITADNIWPVTWTNGPEGVNWWAWLTITTNSTTRAAWRVTANVNSDALKAAMEQAITEKNPSYTLESLGFDVIRYLGLGSSIKAKVISDSGCEASPHTVTFGANAEVDQYNYWPTMVDAKNSITFQIFGSTSASNSLGTSQIFSCPDQ